MDICLIDDVYEELSYDSKSGKRGSLSEGGNEVLLLNGDRANVYWHCIRVGYWVILASAGRVHGRLVSLDPIK